MIVAKAFLKPTRVDATLAAINERFAEAAISITREDALMLEERRTASLADAERLEFGTPAVITIAEAIATSPHLSAGNAADTLAELQDAFYAIRDELPIDVPDSEIVEALRACFDEWGDADEVASMPAAEVMAFSDEYVRTQEPEEGECRIVDDEGRVYAFDPAEWNSDDQADGWDGERWSDEWRD